MFLRHRQLALELLRSDGWKDVLPRRLLALQLQRSDCWKEFLQYEKHIKKLENNRLRLNFLESCKHADIIPQFLNFRIPNNGRFHDKPIHDFQSVLLRKEMISAKEDYEKLAKRLAETRCELQKKCPIKYLPSIVFQVRLRRSEITEKTQTTHSKKLCQLSEEQNKPLFRVENTVKLCDLDETPPKYVLETLSLGPKNSVLNKFDPKDILTELDCFLEFCNKKGIQNETITEINMKTLNYIKKCKKMKESRQVILTKKYLKEKSLLAIPFDKGVGICLMTVDTYKKKMDSLIKLPQFKKYQKPRSNAKHPILAEEDNIVEILQELLKKQCISQELYDNLRPTGSQPPRLYGLAKVHKKDTPLRPVLSMPGSAYHKIGKQIATWLSVVPECQINTSTKKICDSLKNVKLQPDEELVSFDVCSLYTNVPVKEAIGVCADLLFNKHKIGLPVDRETFVKLAEIASCNVIMSTHDGFYEQIDGLAMGSPPAPHLANGWLSQFDPIIKGNASIYERYMDDVFSSISRGKDEEKLKQINSLHKNLTFTKENEKDKKIAILDMCIFNNNGTLSSTWYTKPTDTGLVMNFHSLAPKKYKRSVVSGFVHRIYRACSSWSAFHSSMEKAIKILEHNQYPPDFYNPIIKSTLSKIVDSEFCEDENNVNDTQSTTVEEDQNYDPMCDMDEKDKFMFFVQYRGKCTEHFAHDLHQIHAPCRFIMTLRKIKTVLPSLKPPVPKMFKSNVVYQLQCPRCKSCYVGQTSRQMQRRFTEHLQRAGPIKKHMGVCEGSFTVDDVTILGSNCRGEKYLLTLEALFQNDIKPSLNTKDEYKSRTLTIKF